MNAPSRLFDLPAYQLDHYPQQDMLACKENGEWKKFSCTEVMNTTAQMAIGLLQMGLSGNDFTPELQDKIAIIAHNCPEWVITDLACQQIGAVLVPLYPTINPLEIAYILNDATVKIIFVSDELLYQKVASIKNDVPSLRAIFTFNKIAEARHWTEILQTVSPADEEKIEVIKSKISPQHLATIIYTSGTTGQPKGVMLSHNNIVSNALACYPYLPVSAGSRAISFLPLNHVYERLITYLYLYAGVSIYYAESMDTIANNIREVQPTIFTTVPRLLEKVYEKIMATGYSLKGIKRILFFWALNLARQFDINVHQSPWYKMQLALANKLIFSKWRAALGNRIQAMVSGSAPCQVRLLKIFTAAGLTILEGYGLTESSPVISVNRMKITDRMFGTVGPVIDDVEVKIAGDGEILCKGPNVMMGYYKQPELTAQTIEDGWLHTGDIGMMVDNKFLKITDRKKELFKTSGGKYVAPQPIENKFKESPFIEQLMVVGEGRKFVSALIVPAFHQLKSWCEKNNIVFTSNEEIIHEPKVIALFHKIILQYNELFNHVEQVKKFTLLDKEWTVGDGELTPTLKLKRKVILQQYAAAIEKIYA